MSRKASPSEENKNCCMNKFYKFFYKIYMFN